MLTRPRDTRGRVILALSAGAVVEVAWTILLGLRLPDRYVAHHWVLAWVGLDVMEITMLLVTAYLGWRRRPGPLALVASVAATLYTVDAWFDVTTAGPGDVARSASLLALELPIAAALWWVAARALRDYGEQRVGLAQSATPSSESR